MISLYNLCNTFVKCKFINHVILFKKRPVHFLNSLVMLDLTIVMCNVKYVKNVKLY
jgi:hypothetical protein